MTNGRHPTLGELVVDLKGERSYERLARDCGGTPTAGRLQQIATTPHPRTFPDPDTVQGLARGLGITVTEVVLAAAASLGLPVALGSQPGSITLADVGRLPAPARDAVLSVAREMVRLHEGQPAPGPSRGAPRSAPPPPVKQATDRRGEATSET